MDADAGSEDGSRTIRFRFQAPPQTGTFVFTVAISCDAYMGMELRQEVRMEVKEASADEVEAREKQVLDSWQDLDEEEKLEKELGLGGGLGGLAAAAAAASNANQATDDSDADDTATSDSDYESEDDA
jgi:hypothetical protein